MDLDEDVAAVGQLFALARAGDNEAFDRLTAPHRHELLIHCYRMLGSLQDGEDALQETLLAAWQALAGFESRSSGRARSATAGTVAARRSGVARTAARRPGCQRGRPVPGPETVYVQGESISLAFITALQVLPPRQLAVLVLRDVLTFRATEVANMLATTTESVTSALKRARATMKQTAALGRQASPPAGSPAENALVAQFVRAYESSDVDGLIALLTDDVCMSMPPMPFEYEGKDVIAEFWQRLFRADRSTA